MYELIKAKERMHRCNKKKIRHRLCYALGSRMFEVYEFTKSKGKNVLMRKNQAPLVLSPEVEHPRPLLCE